MSKVFADAMIYIFNQGFTEHDYYIVGESIYISRPHSIKSSELDIEDLSIKAECIKILKNKHVPTFESWSDFNQRNSLATIELFRKSRG